MNSLVHNLLEEQCREWPQCGESYATLESVSVREITVNNHHYKVQFNPGRIISSAAKVDSKSIQSRKCFLCESNRPKEQRKLDFTSSAGNGYSILVNPFPIFRKHLTIPSVSHQPQLIKGKIGDMLELAALLDDFIIFYNGPQCGASAPDHFHFQAGNKGFLPAETEMERLLAKHGFTANEGILPLKDNPAKAIIAKADSCSFLVSWFETLLQRFEVLSPNNTEPMLNLLAWKTGSSYHLVVYPRKLHRPSQFFAEGEANMLISPASIDLGGVFITPLEKDYQKISEKDIIDILSQVSVTDEIFKELTA